MNRGAVSARIVRERRAGWRLPEGAVIVTRPTKFGNPFTEADVVAAGLAPAGRENRAQARAAAVRLFVRWTAGLPLPEGIDLPPREQRDRLLAALPGLDGKTLCCWCPIGGPCHADVLAVLARALNALNGPRAVERHTLGGVPVPDGLVHRPARREATR